jgi:hypothetical protein
MLRLYAAFMVLNVREVRRRNSVMVAGRHMGRPLRVKAGV